MAFSSLFFFVCKRDKRETESEIYHMKGNKIQIDREVKRSRERKMRDGVVEFNQHITRKRDQDTDRSRNKERERFTIKREIKMWGRLSFQSM